MKNASFLLFTLLMACCIQQTRAQFSLDGQVVQRGEYRHGFGTLIGENDEPAAFIGQRARLQAAYKTEDASFYVSIQDIRIWGNTPQVKATDGFLSVHEAWVEVNLSEKWKVKLGRQELNYDNFRFLGNLDWALQARAHDFALVKHENEQMKFHFGGGYNQNAEALSGNLFTIPNQYKVAQMAHYENTWDKFHLSALFWNDGRQFVERNAQNEITNKGVRYMQTLGLPMLRYQTGNLTLSGFAYYQLGRKVTNQKVNAYNLSGQVSQLFPIDEEKGKKLRLTLGTEILSGNNTTGPPDETAAFSPLYGTNHLFNGYMDLFFVGGRFENSLGLKDFFLRTRYDFSPNLFVSACAHAFSSYGQLVIDQDSMRKNFGNEVDLSLGLLINRSFSLQMGYSQLFATESLEMALGQANAANVQNWGYAMLIYRPTMKNRFIGMLF